jgi:Cu+-exporting ATPase
MFNFFKKELVGETTTLKLSGLHCVACSLTIDDELESIDGVFSAKTNYAKQESLVSYDSTKVKIPILRIAIEKLGYKVVR